MEISSLFSLYIKKDYADHFLTHTTRHRHCGHERLNDLEFSFERLQLQVMGILIRQWRRPRAALSRPISRARTKKRVILHDIANHLLRGCLKEIKSYEKHSVKSVAIRGKRSSWGPKTSRGLYFIFCGLSDSCNTTRKCWAADGIRIIQSLLKSTAHRTRFVDYSNPIETNWIGMIPQKRSGIAFIRLKVK